MDVRQVWDRRQTPPRIGFVSSLIAPSPYPGQDMEVGVQTRMSTRIPYISPYLSLLRTLGQCTFG